MVVKLFRTELTATGRPVLMSGEVERGMLDKARRAAVGRLCCPAAAQLGRSALMTQDAIRVVTGQSLLLKHCPPLAAFMLQVDLVFHGPGGVDEQPSEEYKVRLTGAQI